MDIRISKEQTSESSTSEFFSALILNLYARSILYINLLNTPLKTQVVSTLPNHLEYEYPLI